MIVPPGKLERLPDAYKRLGVSCDHCGNLAIMGLPNSNGRLKLAGDAACGPYMGFQYSLVFCTPCAVLWRFNVLEIYD